MPITSEPRRQNIPSHALGLIEAYPTWRQTLRISSFVVGLPPFQTIAPKLLYTESLPFPFTPEKALRICSPQGCLRKGQSWLPCIHVEASERHSMPPRNSQHLSGALDDARVDSPRWVLPQTCQANLVSPAENAFCLSLLQHLDEAPCCYLLGWRAKEHEDARPLEQRLILIVGCTTGRREPLPRIWQHDRPQRPRWGWVGGLV